MQMDGAPIPAELRHHLAPEMATGIDPILAECWAAYPRLKAAGAAYSALVRLAEITNVLDHRDTAIRLSRKWKLTVGGTQIADAMCGRAIAEAMKNVSRLRRMLPIGTTFVYEAVACDYNSSRAGIVRSISCSARRSA